MPSLSRSMLLVALAVALVPTPARAANLTVSSSGQGMYTTVQAAIDAASAGDTITLLPGTYSHYTERREQGGNRRAVGFIDKALTFVGTEGAVITGPTERDSWAFFSLVSDDLTFESLTIENIGEGISAGIGGSILVEGCTLTGVHWGAVSGGGSLIVTGCTFLENKETGAVGVDGAHVELRDSTFEGSTDFANPEGMFLGRGPTTGLVTHTHFTNAKIANAQQGSHILVEDVEAVGVRGHALVSVDYGSLIEARNVRMTGTDDPSKYPCAVYVSNRGRVEGERIVASSMWAMVSGVANGEVVLHDSSLTNWREYAVYLSYYTQPPASTVDVRNNYWGLTSDQDLGDFIIDSQDKPQENPYGTVEYLPVRQSPLAAATETFGSIKRRFGGQ